jgi:hypothetical protein
MIKLNLKDRDTRLGVDADTPLLRLEKAGIERHVARCGSLAHTPQPSGTDSRAARSGKLCRCGTDRRSRATIHRAATLRAGA